MRTISSALVLASTLIGCQPKAADIAEPVCSDSCKAEAVITPRDGSTGVALTDTLSVSLSEEAEVLLTLRGAGGVVLETTEGIGEASLSLAGLVEGQSAYSVEVRHACEPGSDVLCNTVTSSFTTRDPEQTPTPTGSDTGSTDTGTDTDLPTDTGTEPVDTGLDPDPFVPLGDADELDAAALATIEAEIDAILNSTTDWAGVYVVDADSGQVVYAFDEDVPYEPASNTKLFTTGVAFDQLGEEHRFRTAAYTSGVPDASGAVSALTVVVEHDFTWSSSFYADPYVAADRLAEQLYDEGLRSVTGSVVLSGEVVFEGYSLSEYTDFSYYRGEALDALLSALDLYGIDVSGSASTSSSLSSPGGVLLTERFSPPLHVADHPLNASSHNEFADAQMRHAGWQLWGGSSYADGEAAVADWLDGLGIDSSTIAFYDGSGISHDNRVTARQVVEMQLALYDAPSGLHWERTLSTAGHEGTLAGRMLGADTSGRFMGKTGTLWHTIATSGVLHHAHDGHRYVFGILFNDVASQTTARANCDDIVESVARDHRGLGTRPGAPLLHFARGVGSGRVEVSWSSVQGATGYALWVSTDGAWRRADARFESSTRAVVGDLPDAPVAFRVAALNDQGASELSDTYAASPSSAGAQVLLVDGNDRWGGQTENTLGEGHDSLHTVGRSVPGRAFDSADNDAVLSGLVDLSDYDAVIWLLGEESTADDTFDAAERAEVEAFVAAGGSLLVSGAEIGWDLDYSGDAATAAFYADVLKATYASDDAGTYVVVPRAGGLFGDVGEVAFYTPGTMNIAYPDVLQPTGGAVAELDYWGGTGGVAALSYDGPYKLVHLGFPLESIDALEVREAVIDRSLGFFGL